MKFLKKFNESLIRSYNKQQYDDYQIEKLWKVNETDIIEIFSDLTDEYDATVKVNFYIQFPSKLINILKVTPEKCESYIESGLWPVIVLTVHHKEEDATKIENYINETAVGLDEYTLSKIESNQPAPGDEGNWDDGDDDGDEDNEEFEYTTIAIFDLDINSTGPKVSHNISIKQLEEMLSEYQTNGSLSSGYKLSIDKKFIDKAGITSIVYKKGYQKIYRILLEKTCDISINNIDNLANDKNAILSFCKKLSESSNIHDIRNYLKIEDARGRNKVLFNVIFYER